MVLLNFELKARDEHIYYDDSETGTNIMDRTNVSFAHCLCAGVTQGWFDYVKRFVELERKPIVFLMSRRRKERFIADLTPAFVFTAFYGESDIMEFLLKAGAKIDGQLSMNGRTALHLCKSPQDARFLLQHGASPLVKDTGGHAALYHNNIKEERRGQTIVEFEFTQAKRGHRRFDSTAPLKVLQAQRDDGGAFDGEQGSYLKSWEESIAVPQHGDDVATSDCIRIRPGLSEFQNFLVSGLSDALADSQVEQMRFLIMGYLTPIDLLNGWDSLVTTKKSKV